VAYPSELWLFDDAPIFGGAEVFALRLARTLAKRGSPRPRIVCPESTEMAQRCAAEGIEHVAATFPPLLPRDAPRWPGGVLRTRLLLERVGSEAIAIGNTARAQAYLSAAALTFRRRPRIVQLVHEQHTFGRRTGRFAYRRVGALVAVGANVADACRRALPGIPIDQANLFLDPDGVAALPPRGAADGERAIGVLTRLIPEKGVLELVEELASVGSWSSARIAGRAQDGRYARRVRQRIESLGLGDRIRLIGQVDDLRSFFATVDVLVVPSTGTEGQGFPIVEALWHGRPCLVRRSALSTGDFEGLPVLPFDDSAELDRGLRELPGQPVPAEVVRRRFGPERALEAILRAAARS
jgi:glycosyltransferase involved in cell wall biosynthesis